jgi:hypothetical protein
MSALLMRPMRAALIVAFFGIGCVAASAQGYYLYDDTDGTYIYAGADTYPGGGSCGSFSMWNDLNGNYQSGWAPTNLEGSVWATDGVGYSWSYGFTIEYPNPYGGCDSESFSYGGQSLSIHNFYMYFSANLPGGSNGPGTAPGCNYNAYICDGGAAGCTAGSYTWTTYVSSCPTYVNMVGLLCSGGSCGFAGACTSNLATPATTWGYCT